MASREPAAGDHPLLALYDEALPVVYGYLLSRCRNRTVAEDLTAETFLAAVTAVRTTTAPALSTGWLVTVARNKLVDHWRRRAREEAALTTLAVETADASWDAVLEPGPAEEALGRLGPHHRAALVLRYVDGLSVPEVAGALGRTRHATEALIVRARAAFRRTYEEAERHG